MNNIKSFHLIDAHRIKGNIIIIGVGAMGSMVAEQLIRLNLASKIIVYDMDVVEEKNLNNQAYLRRHIGMTKVDAMKDLSKLIDDNATLRGRVREVTHLKNVKDDDIVVLAIDNFHARGRILDSIATNPLVISGGISSRGGNVEVVRGTSQYKALASEYMGLESGIEYPDEDLTPCGSPISIYHRIRTGASMFCENIVEHFENKEEKNINIIFDVPSRLFLTDNKL